MNEPAPFNITLRPIAALAWQVPDVYGPELRELATWCGANPVIGYDDTVSLILPITERRREPLHAVGGDYIILEGSDFRVIRESDFETRCERT